MDEPTRYMDLHLRDRYRHLCDTSRDLCNKASSLRDMERPPCAALRRHRDMD